MHSLLSFLLFSTAFAGKYKSYEVSVCKDATYWVSEKPCSGSGKYPDGDACPKAGDYTKKDCHKYLKSWIDYDAKCIAPEDAECKKIHTGAWGCVFPSIGCDYYKPTDKPPAYKPPTYKPPTYKPPTYKPPAYKPPTYKPPTYKPPTCKPPAYKPTYKPTPKPTKPPTYKPPAYKPTYKPTPKPTKPPAYKPPTYKPPTYKPPTYKPPTYKPSDKPTYPSYDCDYYWEYPDASTYNLYPADEEAVELNVIEVKGKYDVNYIYYPNGTSTYNCVPYYAAYLDEYNEYVDYFKGKDGSKISVLDVFYTKTAYDLGKDGDYDILYRAAYEENWGDALYKGAGKSFVIKFKCCGYYETCVKFDTEEYKYKDKYYGY